MNLKRRAQSVSQSLQQYLVLKNGKEEYQIRAQGRRIMAGSQSVLYVTSKDKMAYRANSAAQLAQKLSQNMNQIVNQKLQKSGQIFTLKWPVKGAVIRMNITSLDVDSAVPYKACSPYLLHGRKIRVLNPKTGWSIVVEVTQTCRPVQESLLGLSDPAANAIGIRGIFPEWVQLKEL